MARSAEYADFIKEMRRKFPPLLPTRIYFRSAKTMGKAIADTDLILENKKPKSFVVRIQANLPFSIGAHFLVHEWAHVISWTQEDHDTVEEHGPEWGLTNARIYQEMIHP